DLRKWAANLQGSSIGLIASAIFELDTATADTQTIRLGALASPSAHPLWLRWLSIGDSMARQHVVRTKQAEWSAEVTAYIAGVQQPEHAPTTSATENLVAYATVAADQNTRMNVRDRLLIKLPSISHAYYRRVATARLSQLLLETGRRLEAVDLVAASM